MYKVPDTFEDLLKEQQAFLKQQAGKIRRNPYYRHNSFEDIYQMVQTSGFHAWRYQKQQAVNGLAPYAFGTYFNNCIKTGLKDYDELRISSNVPVDEGSYKNNSIDSLELSDYYMKGLSDLEKSVFKCVYLEHLELSDAATKLNISEQYVRLILKNIANKTKDKICYQK